MAKTPLLVTALLLVLHSFLHPVMVNADEAPLVKAIEVRYVGPALIDREKILAFISTKPGARLYPHGFDEDIKRLHGTGEIANARILSEQTKGGVNIIVVVECRALYGGTRFVGNTKFNDKKLARLMKLKPGQTVDETSILTSRREILELYRKSGYPDASASYQIEPPDAQALSWVTFTIEEKSPGNLRQVSFTGNAQLSSAQLKEAMTQKEKGLQNLFRTGGRTDAESIARDVKAIELLYRNYGFFDARVAKVHKIRVDPTHHDLVITIDEGKVYQVSDVEVSGAKALSLDKDLASRLKTQSGKPFSNQDLEDDMQMILEYYHSKGYVDATVTPRLVAPGEKTQAKMAGKVKSSSD